ncbi:4418_t:CDS:2, partial [Acaulospora colombiana]
LPGLKSLKMASSTSLDPKIRKVNANVNLEPQRDRIKLPVPGERNILITSSLPYVNNIPHLGNIIGNRFLHRYARARNYNTLYICGTDEYGTATETKALEEGITCQELCDKYYVIHSQDARGDQCDACGHLLNATELVNPRCKRDGDAPITRESKHMFLDLESLQKKVEDWVEISSTEGKWSSNGKTITKSWLKEGLNPRCITRDLKWGTPVPLEEMKDKVFYVWFDAPIGYLSITANYTKEWEKWWKNPEQVKLYQFMGKDNVPFHTVIFPCTLIGTGEDWTLLHHINTSEYLNYENTKFSKSRNIGVFGTDAKDTGIPVSVWRYYLISSRPETNDSIFTWKEFIAKNNNELLANLGNFVNRVMKFIASKYNSVLPSFTVDHEAEQNLIKNVNSSLENYLEALENVKLRAGLEIAMEISRLGNGYLQESKLDNALFANSPEKCASVIGVSVNLIYLISAVISPYMPSTGASIVRQLNAPPRNIPDTWTIDIEPGHHLGKAEYLFTRIDAQKEQEYLNRYGGASKTDEVKKKTKKKAPKNVNDSESLKN